MKFLLISESVLLLPCAGEVSIDTNIAITEGKFADNICRLADIDARESTVRVEHESECAALIINLRALRAEGFKIIRSQRKRIKARAMMLGNKCKPLAALGNESDADLPAAALFDAGSRLDACGIDFIGSALCRGQEACKSRAIGSLAAVKSFCRGLGIIVGKKGLCLSNKVDSENLVGVKAVDLRSCSLNSLDRDLAGVALHCRSVLVEERNDISLAAVDGSLDLSCGLVALLAALLTKALVQPVLNMTEDLDHIQENVPYRELIPFAESIHSDRILRENNEKMRQEFTANVSHELKTPLTSISGYAELIETGIAKPEDVPDFGRKIHSEATRMIQLVNDILQLSKLDTVSETGDTPVMETVDLLEVAKECVERQKLNARRAYISLTYLGESAPVLGSRALLDELCQNLCDNAIRYNRPGGKVQIITACNRDGHCSLTVTDNGIGIPREAQASVFERFYRVDKSRSKATGGTGLGLAIVKHIARIHNARIKLESQVDVGTTITVTFPTAS